MIHTVKSLGIVNKAEIDVFLEFSCFFHDPADVGNLISGSSALSKTSLNTWKFMVHVLLKPSLENFQHYLRVRWVLLCCSLSILQKRQWQPTPVLLPGKSHGQRSLVRLQPMGSQRVRHNWATKPPPPLVYHSVWFVQKYDPVFWGHLWLVGLKKLHNGTFFSNWY